MKKKEFKSQGWKTTDQDEIERRRHRGKTENFHIESLELKYPIFANFRINNYHVEIRSTKDFINSCSCADYQINSLGTCKHIEAVLFHLQEKFGNKFSDFEKKGSSRTEIFLDRTVNPHIKIRWPKNSCDYDKQLYPLFSSDGSLLKDPLIAFPTISYIASQENMKKKIRLSRHIKPWLEEIKKITEMKKTKEAFLIDVKNKKRNLDILKVPLYPYQQEGMLHLAFNEKALLADEMGLGKTIQAIATCQLLQKLKGIERVLVISPASLKTEWEEQITKFTNLPTQIIQGTRSTRLSLYRKSSFFYLANYEQIRQDFQQIQELLAPDVIILDEAQRIKNWQTKTAASVKKLTSPYVFILTGTPIENRIDEIYSLMQVIDPTIFGPLFQFNRDFYNLDEKGKPIGYKNLDQLHRRLRPFLLRRLKSEVEEDLPGRTVNNYFVKMDPEQAFQYEEYNGKVARLLAVAKKRPLTKEEFDRLQRYLACMRMLCDTPYILDNQYTVCPKIKELESILEELLVNSDNKIIIFSEWARMLDLVRKLIDKLQVDYALHTGNVPQHKRRIEINRFKKETSCRIFLSTDSGSTGLNLQTANIVINIDLPWNPAKLEQRIARAWRKQQKRSVQVINLVCENSIESNMLNVLSQKQSLAQGVLDGIGDIKDMPMPSGRAVMIERLESVTNQKLPNLKVKSQEKSEETHETLKNTLLTHLGDYMHLLEVYAHESGQDFILVVLDSEHHSKAKNLISEHFSDIPKVQLMDTKLFETLQQLMQNGLVKMEKSPLKTLYRSSFFETSNETAKRKNLLEVQKQFTEADRKLRMARLLATGGFAIESLSPAKEALELGGKSIKNLSAISPQEKMVIEKSLLFCENWKNKSVTDEEAKISFSHIETLMQEMTQILNQAALR